MRSRWALLAGKLVDLVDASWGQVFFCHFVPGSLSPVTHPLWPGSLSGHGSPGPHRVPGASYHIAPAALADDHEAGRGGVRRAGAAYRAFVSEMVGKASPWENLRGRVLLGPDSFVERLRPALCDKSEIAEDRSDSVWPAVHRRRALLPRPRGGGGKADRDRAMREAILDYGCALAETARHVGLHYATISKIANHPRV